MGSVGEEDEEESACLLDEFPRKNNVDRVHRREGESDFLIMITIDFTTNNEDPKKYSMMFFMITEDSAACYFCPYIDDNSAYHKVVDDGFPKIQTMKGFIRFCGWLESGRPKTFKLKELEYIALSLNKNKRFIKDQDFDLKKGFRTEIEMARDKQLVILKNATKEQVQVKCRNGKDRVYLRPQQIVVVFGGEVCRII